MSGRTKKALNEAAYAVGWERRQTDGSLLTGAYFRLRRFEERMDDVVLRLVPAGGRILDLGAGDGDLLNKAGSRFACKCGVDIAENRLRRLTRSLDSGQCIDCVVADLDGAVPFADASFDVVTCVATIEHVVDPYNLVREAHRVLREGGVFVVGTPNVAWLPYRIALLRGEHPRTSLHHGSGCWDGGHLRYFTFSSLVGLLESEGFGVIQRTGSGVCANLRRWWPTMLLGDCIVKAVKQPRHREQLAMRTPSVGREPNGASR